jgi:Ca-activated chloride channel family protein
MAAAWTSRASAWVVAGLSALALFVVVPAGQVGTPPNPPQPVTTTIEGTVVDDAGVPAAGVTVTLEPEQSNTVIATVVTVADGRFRFDRVGVGRVAVRASRAGYRSMLARVTVPASGRVMVRFALQRGPEREVVEAQGAIVGGRDELVKTAPVPAGTPPPPAAPIQASEQSLRAGRGGAGIQGQGMARQAGVAGWADAGIVRHAPYANTETYGVIKPNPFNLTTNEPLSTFAADVDTASYTNVRRFLTAGELPPVDAVRVEEFVNYFHYQYPNPTGADPVSITTEVGDAPWAPGHKLVLVGLKAKPIEQQGVGGRNLVLLIDVSGSMQSANKLGLVKTGLRMFVDTLRDDDRVAIVVYAGASGLVLPSTPARSRERIHDAIEGLHAGGSTNGAQGLQLAYTVAEREFVKGGINRVILATDGDFNVGVTSQGDLLRLIEEKKQSGIFLSVLGVGTGNLKDQTMEMLADKGNGHYAYLDSLYEARRVLVQEGGATLETVAKDVKFQVEFNPATVAAWKLIGYENRLLAHQDFNDDKKDGGELGAGHTVTVLYEVVPVGVELPKALATTDGRPVVDPLAYQSDRRPNGTRADLLMVKIRYKRPAEDVSALLTQPVRAGGAVRNLPFAAAVAEFGLLLRETESDPAAWTRLTTQIKTLPVATAEAADRQNLAALVDLAAGLRKLTVGE